MLFYENEGAAFQSVSSCLSVIDVRPTSGKTAPRLELTKELRH